MIFKPGLPSNPRGGATADRTECHAKPSVTGAWPTSPHNVNRLRPIGRVSVFRRVGISSRNGALAI